MTPCPPGVVELEDPQLGQPVAALVDHQVAGEGVDVLEPDRGVVREERPATPPGAWARAARRRARSPARCRCAAPGTGPRRRCRRARGSTPGPRGAARSSACPSSGALGVEHVVLAGGLGAGDHDDEPVGAGASDADPEPLVGLVEDELVVGLPLAEAVAPDLVGAPGVVDGRVVEVLAGAVPGRPAEHAVDLVVEQLAGVEVLDPDRVALVADDVDGVGQQPAVGADARAAEGEEVVTVGEVVEVEQHLLPGQRRAGRGWPRRRAAAASSRRGRRPAPGTRRRTRVPRTSGRSTSGRAPGSGPTGRSRGCGP